MEIIEIVLSMGVAFGLAYVLTAGVRKFALSRAMLDVPNPRSSHTRPTARGGGLAIAVPVFAATAVLAILGRLPWDIAWAMLVGGTLVTGIGWLDDRRGVPAWTRALVHLMAGAWTVAMLGGFPSIRIGAAVFDLGPVGAAVAVVGIAWAINLYNFMDGIDGIAAGEAVSLGLVGGGLLVASGRTDLGVLALVAAAASAGFLVWNWAPAKIFMGDVGSGFLGYFFAAIAITSERVEAVPLLVWTLLAGVFLFDATVTLVRRMIRGERWYLPHNNHAYQRAVRSGQSHAAVTTAVLGLNAVLASIGVILWVSDRFVIPGIGLAATLLTWAYLRVERALPMG